MSSIEPVRPVSASFPPRPLRRRDREEEGGQQERREEPREQDETEDEGPAQLVDFRA